MDHAQRGASAIAKGDFKAAVTHYTDALTQNVQAVDYYIKRSTAYTRISPPDHDLAFKDSEIAVVLATKRAKRELIAQAQLRRAIALFGLERWADSKQCLDWVKKYNEKEKSLAIWEMKIAGKLKGLGEEDHRGKVTVKEVPDVELPTITATKENKKREEEQKPANDASKAEKAQALSSTAPPAAVVQTPPNKIRHEWFQQHDAVIVTLFAKGIPKDKTTVDIKPSSLEVSFPLPTGSDYDFSLEPLFAAVDPSASSFKIMSTKAEFSLKKASPGQKWASLEGTGSVEPSSKTEGEDEVKDAILADAKKQAGPAYPTSSKSGPKNWDKLASDLTKKPKKTDSEEDDEDAYIDDDESDPVNGFFKTLYKGADDDTRRAMMKSYQESNGTALSTNWAEVGKGKVETSPPDGMEARKW